MTVVGRVLEGAQVDSDARVVACKVCGRPIAWGKTRAGKANPFDIVDGVRTAITHFSTCPNVREFEHGRKAG